MSLLTSILEIFSLGKTNLQISCDEYHMRCYGSLMGPEGRATCECSLVIVSLKGTQKVQRSTFNSQADKVKRRRTFDLIYVIGSLLPNLLCFLSI